MQSILSAVTTQAPSTSADNYVALQGNNATPATTESQVEAVVAIACTISNLWVRVATAPASGKSWVVTLVVNGVDSALTVTIADTATSASDTTDVVSLAAGNRVSLKWHPVGTPTATGATCAWGAVFSGTTDGESLVLQCCMNQQAANTALFYSIQGDGAGNATESNVYSLMPCAGTFSNLYGLLETTPGAGKTTTFTLVVNGTPSALTCSLANVTNFSDTSHSVSVVAGDLVSIKVVTQTGAASSRVSAGMRFVPTVNGESLAIMPRSGSIAQATTSYRAFAFATFSGTETNRQMLMPYPCVLRKLNLLSSPASGQTITAHVRKGAANMTPDLTCAITGPATSNSDTTDGPSVVAGDLIDLQCITSPTTGTIAVGASMVYYVTPSSLIGPLSGYQPDILRETPIGVAY